MGGGTNESAIIEPQMTDEQAAPANADGRYMQDPKGRWIIRPIAIDPGTWELLKNSFLGSMNPVEITWSLLLLLFVLGLIVFLVRSRSSQLEGLHAGDIDGSWIGRKWVAGLAALVFSLAALIVAISLADETRNKLREQSAVFFRLGTFAALIATLAALSSPATWWEKRANANRGGPEGGFFRGREKERAAIWAWGAFFIFIASSVFSGVILKTNTPS